MQHSNLQHLKTLFRGTALIGSAVTLGCGDGTGSAAGAPGFSRKIVLAEFESELARGPASLEIELLPGGLVAREVEIEEPAMPSDVRRD